MCRVKSSCAENVLKLGLFLSSPVHLCVFRVTLVHEEASAYFGRS